jgi:hypothetical protein
MHACLALCSAAPCSLSEPRHIDTITLANGNAELALAARLKVQSQWSGRSTVPAFPRRVPAATPAVRGSLVDVVEPQTGVQFTALPRSRCAPTKGGTIQVKGWQPPLCQIRFVGQHMLGTVFTTGGMANGRPPA